MSADTKTSSPKPSSSKYLQAIGPGIVFAATSIGVSHVVQATRAGADFGYALIILVILAHLVKLPFFQIGPKYASATGESLLDAYQRIGSWAYGLFMLLTLSTMFIVQAAVTIVAAGVLANIFDIGWSVFAWAAAILLVVIGLLFSGGYRLMDRSLKVLMVIFALTCLISLVAVLWKDTGVSATAVSIDIDYFSAGSIAFMVALVGWMPTTIEVSVWYSFWVVERNAELKENSETELSAQEKTRASVFDFNVGYGFCFVFAMAFLVLGAKLIFGSGQSLSASAIGFSAQLIQIFVEALGNWSKPVVSVLIFIAMFSTCIAVADGFSHVASKALQRFISNSKQEQDLHQHHKWYRMWVILIAVGGWLVIYQFAGQLRSLVDFATTISFVFAPFFAYLNLRAMKLSNVPDDLSLSPRFILFSRICFAALLSFSLFYIIWRFF